MAHRNPKAQPISKPKTGNDRRGNANAQKDARDNLKDSLDKLNSIGVDKGRTHNPTPTNTPKSIPYIPSHKFISRRPSDKSVDAPKSPKDRAPAPSTSAKPYSYSFKSPFKPRQGVTYRDLKREREKEREQEEWRKTHTLEGQIEAEIESVTTTGENTVKYNTYSTILNKYWNEYIENVDEEALREWYYDNVVYEPRYNIEMGMYIDTRTFKKDAPPPPMGTDADGNEIDITDAWNYCQAYDYAINDYIKEQQQVEATESLYEKGLITESEYKKRNSATKVAWQDENTPDSFLDVFRYALDPSESGFKALKNYVRDYLWNPFYNADFKELGINTLANLIETLDPGLSVRALAASNDIIGTDPRYTSDPRAHAYEGQNVWYYGDSGAAHSIQTKLVELGADKLLTGAVRHASDYDTGGYEHHRFGKDQTAEEIENAIKEAGLWDDYLEMRKAWFEYKQDYRADDKALNAIKSVYGDAHSGNYYPDTGSTVKDIGLFVATDPTLILGGGLRSFASSGIKSISKIAVRTTIKDFANAWVSPENAKLAEKAIKQFSKRNMENLLGKSQSEIAEEVQRLGARLREVNALDPKAVKVDSSGHLMTFEDAVTRKIYDGIDTTNFHVIRSMHNISEFMNKVDSTILKSIFAFPYVPISATVRGYRGVRSEMERMVSTAYRRKELFGEPIKGLPKKFDEMLDTLAKRNLLDQIVARDIFSKIQSVNRAKPKEVSLADMEETYIAMAKQPNVEVWDSLDDFIFAAYDLSSSMDRPLAEFRDGKITAAEYKTAVDSQIASISGVATNRSELKMYLENLYKNAPEGDRGRIGKIYNELNSKIRNIETIEKQLLDREVETLSKELSHINNFTDFIKFSERYFIRTAEEHLPEEFEKLLSAKLAEFNGDITKEEFETVLRNFERNKNFSTDLNPKDADIPLPESVKSSKGFAEIIPPEIHSDVERLQKYFTKEEHDWKGLMRIKQFMYSISKVEDMPPKALHDVLQTGIRELTIRKSLNGTIDERLYSLMLDVDSKLYDNALTIENVSGRNVEINAMHLDHLTVFDEYMNHPYFKDVLKTFDDPNTAIGKALRDAKKMYLSSTDYTGNPTYELLMQINDLIAMNKAYFKFRNSVSNEVVGLSDRQIYAVLDRLFGITKGSPKNYFNQSMRGPEKFIEDLETLLVSEYGEIRCSLDGARSQMNMFDPKLFKDFAKDIEDIDIQKRIQNIAQPGHIDPMNDVRVQMLYTILRDKTVIRDYNALSKNERPVIFCDLETDGLNKNYNGITSIAFKKWIEIDENASLSDILSIIESEESETLFRRSLSETELRRIDDSLLKGLYSKHPTLAETGRDKQLADYKKFYCKKPDGKKIFSTEEDMMKFINQYITDASVIKERKGLIRKHTVVTDRNVPCLVFHNANGFDSKFLISRMRNLKVGIPKGAVKHLSDIEKYSHNTLARLRGLEKDVVLTDYQKEFVQQQVINLAREVEHFNNGFKFLDPRALDMALYDLQKICNPSIKEVDELSNISNRVADVFRFEQKDIDILNDVDAINESASGYRYHHPERLRRVMVDYNVQLLRRGHPRNLRYFAEKDLPYKISNVFSNLSSSISDEFIISIRDDLKAIGRNCSDYYHSAWNTSLRDEARSKVLKSITEEGQIIAQNISKKLFKYLKDNNISYLNAGRIESADTIENIIKPTEVSVDKYSKDSVQAKLGVPNADKTNDELLKILDSAELRKLRNDLKVACQDVGHMQNRYEKHIIQKILNVGDDFSVSKTYYNLMREAQEVVPDRPWSYLSYDVMFRGSEAAKYFDWDVLSKLPADYLHNMKQFTDWVEDKLKYSLRFGADAIIEPYEDFFRGVIDSALYFVKDVDRFNEFAYLKYLKQPTTPMEAYLVAQKLYDDVLKYADIPMTYKEGSLRDTLVKDYLAGRSVPDDFRKYILIESMQKLEGLGGSIKFKDGMALQILKGERLQADIFNDVIGDVPHYIRSVATPEYRAVADIKELKAKLSRRTKSFVGQSALLNSSEFANLKTIKVQNAYDHLNDIIKLFESISEDDKPFWITYAKFKNVLNEKRMEIFDAYRLNRLLRTADGAISDDSQLISEILFTNGMRKVIPKMGNELHVRQVNELIDRINKMDSDYIMLAPEGDHIIVTVNPNYKPTFFRDSNGEMVARFPGNATEYRLIPEEAIGFPEFEELFKAATEDSPIDIAALLDIKGNIEEFYKLIQQVYRDLDDLTEGASRGTLGIVSSYNREAKLVSSFSDRTVRGTLKLDYTGDQRLWDHLSFDKSILGDFDNSWKLGSNSEDFDVLINLANTMDEASGRLMSERYYIDTFFGKNSPCKLNSLANDFSNEEILSIFNNSDEFVCVSLHEANTASGFEVRQLKLKDTFSVELAKRTDAIYVPYDLYLDLSKTINTAEVTSKLLKIWLGFIISLKVTQLSHPGTVIRNWIDATYKTAGNEGSLINALGYELVAAKRLCDAHKIMHDAGTEITEALWKNSNYDRYMTYDDYRDLVGFLANESVSGGESARTKKIIQEYFTRGKREEALGIDGFKTLGSDVQRFEQVYDEKTIQPLLDKVSKSDPTIFNEMDRDYFTSLFIARKYDNAFKYLNNTDKWNYNVIANAVIDQATKNIRHPLRTGRQVFNKVSGMLLAPMSQVEQIVRYSQLLALRDLGHTNASAYKHIIDTHFNYNNKTMRMKCLEAVLPFATFQYNNILYWVRQIDENPRLIRWLEQTFGRLSFQDLDELEDENGYINQSLEYRIASGGIPLGSDGLYFKLNPSYLDVMNWFYGGPDDFLSNVAPPIRSLAKASIEEMGFDSYKLFSEVQFSHSSKEWMYELSESVPVGNYIAGFVRHAIDSKPWNKLDEPLERVLVMTMPSLFGAVKSYDLQEFEDFEEWQKSLAAEGKWYDAQQGKVVDLSEKNELGLNNPNLTFEQRKILEFLVKGRLYDQNQCKFVSEEDFIHGGLNKDWDFSKEGEWEKYCDLKKKILGLEYDLNLRKFVKHKTPGGLNADNLDWDTICDLNEEMHGLYWDSNQGMFVEKKYLTEGGLNDDNLSFSELCAYMYGIRGKVWDRASHQFVKVEDDPAVVLKVYNKYNDWTIFNNLGFDPTNIAPDYLTYMKDGMLRSVNGKYVLSDDQISNQNIYDELIKKFSYGFSHNYHRGFYSGHSYNAIPLLPENRPYQNMMTIKGKPFNFAYSSTGNYAALRMAASGYKAYDDYYKFEFNYNYSYRNPTGFMNTIKRFDYYRPDHLLTANKFAMYSR